MHLVGNNSSMQPTHYGLWVNLYFFTMCIYKHCFLPMYLFLPWNVVLKCLALCLKTIIAARFLHLYACLTCSSVHASSLHPLLANHHLCYVDVSFFVFFLIFAICYFSLWFICFVSFFFELMLNLIFGLFFKFTCLFFLLVAILHCTNLVRLQHCYFV